MTKEKWYVKVKFTEYLDFGDEKCFDQSRNFDTLEEATDYYNKKYDALSNFKGSVHCQIPKKSIIIDKPVKISVPLTETERLEKENAEYKKVLDVIFKKRVDLDLLKQCKTFEEYNCMRALSRELDLTKEEFDTLKRWCEKWPIQT